MYGQSVTGLDCGDEERLLAFGGTTRVNHCKAVLLSFGDDKVPVM